MGQEPEECLRQALERAVARGTLLHMIALRRGSGQAQQRDEQDDWYFMNTDVGRRAVDKIRRGELELDAAVTPNEVRLEVERPNIFVLYEQNIGLLTPLIAEELRDAEKTYPADWIEEAFRIAVEQNARRWRYVRGVLERWAEKGKDSGGEKRERRWYTEEEYEKFIKH
jgi:DnaD/phage-associated family protein